MVHERDRLRLLACDAKGRLKNGFWDEMKDKRSLALRNAEKQGISRLYVDECLQACIGERIRKYNSEEDELYESVKEMMDDGEVVNPIGRLINRARYERMDAEARGRYVLELSETYQRLVERYQREKRMKDQLRKLELRF